MKVLSLQGGFKWLVLFLEVVRFSNILNDFLFIKVFSQGYCFGSAHGDFTRDFHLKIKVLSLQGGFKWEVAGLEVVKFYNINDFLCSKNFSSGFSFGSTHGDSTRNFHLINKNIKNVINLWAVRVRNWMNTFLRPYIPKDFKNHPYFARHLILLLLAISSTV